MSHAACPGDRLPISCVVITRDAERHLGATLDSAACCAERLVLDCGSSDGTVSLALAAGARVEYQPFLGFGPQKRRACELASHDWILSLDADEMLDGDAIEGMPTLPLDDATVCWEWRRRTFIGRRELRYGPWGNERVLRLFNRRHARFSDHAVHERVQADAAARLAPGTILHHSFTGCDDVLVRAARYAVPKAAILRAKREHTPAWLLPARGAAAFAKSWILQGGWRDGAAGFVVALSRVVDSTLGRAIVLCDDPPPPPSDRAEPPSPA